MIEVKNGCFNVEGNPFFMYSGEIHYFRLDPKDWPKHLKLAKEAGLNTVSSYIPWGWHENREGKFDLTGRTHPQRNLAGFIKEVEKHGLKLSVRIGPVSNAELVHEGVPGWLLDNYSEVYVKGREVTNLPHVTLLSYNNKTFIEFVKKWYAELLPIIKKNQWPNGAVSMIQICNEIGMVHWLNKAADYSPNTEKLYRKFLAKRYENVSHLNNAYETKYPSFSDIKQPPNGSDKQNKKLLWDWMDFYNYYYAYYFNTLYTECKNHGIYLPVLANIPQFYDYDVRGRGIFSPMTTVMFKEFSSLVPEVVFGGAYQMRRLDYENFHDVSITSEVVKMITSPGVPIICAELQTGIMRDRPRLYNPDVELNLKTSAGHGLNGLNCYMFSGGKNDMEFGSYGTYHEWQAAVTPEGKKRKHFKAISDFGRLIKTFGNNLAGMSKRIDTSFAFYSPYYNVEYLYGPEVDDWDWKKNMLFFDGLARLVQLNNINFDMTDLKKASVNDLLKKKSLILFSLGFLDEEAQYKLVDYVKKGGNLIINPYLPEKNLLMKKCAILADYLGVRTQNIKAKPLTYFAYGKDYLANGVISDYKVSGKHEVLAKNAGGSPVALRIKKEKGQALVLGMGFNHMFDYNIDLIKEFCKILKIEPSIETDKDIHAVLREDESSGLLFLFNYHDEYKKTKVKMVLPGEEKPETLPKYTNIEFANRQGKVLPLNYKLKSGDVIRYATVEILSISEKGKVKTIEISANKEFEAELELETKSKTAYVDGKKVKTKYSNGRLNIVFLQTSDTHRIIIK